MLKNVKKESMKEKFKIFFLAIFIVFAFSGNSYSLDDRCESIMKKLIPHPEKFTFDELDYYDYYQPSVKLEKTWNYEKDEWEWLRDNKNNLIILKIFDYKIIDENKLKIGNKLLEINGNKVSELSNEEIDELIDDYNLGDYEEYLTDEEKKKKFNFKFLNSENKIVDYKLGLIELDDNSQADAVVKIEIKNISNINVKENQFSADASIETSWQIKNLYKIIEDDLIVKDSSGKVTGYWYCIYNEKEFEEMGVGQVFSEPFNAIKKDKTLITKEYIVHISDGYYTKKEIEKGDYEKYIDITLREKGNFVFSNKYNLKAFPFDRQILSIKVLDTTRSLHTLDMRTDNWTQYHLDNYKEKGEILEWKIENVQAKYFSYIDPIYLTSYVGPEIIVEIQRDFQYYIFKVICPIILILLVCWSVFWIHPKEIESRLTITIVCLLSLIAYNFVIDEDLPKLSYLTIIDYIILLSYVFATIPNFLTIASFEFHRTNNKNWQILDKNSKFYGPVIYVGLVVIIILFNSTNNPYTASFLRIFSQVE